MVHVKKVILVTAGLLVLFTPLLAYTQSDFPNKTIQIVVPFSPGGTHDLTARVIGEKMSSLMGVPVVVVNKVGGGASIGTAFVATSKPDGYTLLDRAGSFSDPSPYPGRRCLQSDRFYADRQNGDRQFHDRRQQESAGEKCFRTCGLREEESG